MYQLYQHPRWNRGKKNPPGNAEEHWFDPWVRKIPWSRKWQPTPVFLPGKSNEQKSLVGNSPCGLKRVGHNLVKEQQEEEWNYS